jgi:hypothetical protein
MFMMLKRRLFLLCYNRSSQLQMHNSSSSAALTHDAEAPPAGQRLDAQLAKGPADDGGHLPAEEADLGGQHGTLLGKDGLQRLAQLQFAGVRGVR